MKKIIYRILGFIVLLAVLGNQESKAANTTPLEELKNGIVQINAGVVDQEGQFHGLKHASGFLITNNEQNVYIVTLQSSISISNEEKDNWMKENGLSEGTANYNVNTALRVVVKGDVSSEVSVVNQSERENFVILKSESVIREKSCLKIGNNDEIKDGDIVYALGFSKELSGDENAKYTQEDVSVKEGKIDSSSIEVGGVKNITHNSAIDTGEVGGPLVDEQGYVIGVNQKVEDSLTYALSVESVKDILDSYGIEYGSKILDQAYTKLQDLYGQGNEMLEQRYQKKSLTAIKTELEIAKSVLESDTYELEAVTEEVEKLESIINQAVPKMKRTRMLIIGLGVVILILIAFLVLITREIKKMKGPEPKKETSKKEKQSKSKEDLPKTPEKLVVQSDKFERSENPAPVQREVYVLQRVSTGEQIVLGEGNITIGKSSERADYAIKGNTTISRVHAEIRKQRNGYEIVDRGSSNGTFVNGERVSGPGTVLRNQDRVKLSNEEFIFMKM